MRYSGLIRNDLAAAPGISVTFFTQGCPHRCKGCHNPETWNFEGGKEFTPSVLEETVNFVASPGSLVYTIHIDNQSETAIAYTFGVENVYGNLPLRFSVNNSTPTAGSASLSMNMAADSSATLTLSVLWEQEGSADYIGMVDMLRFTVEAAQID